MKRYFACCLVAFLTSSAASRPPPPSDYPDYVCPVGGERFEQYEGSQNRLDQEGRLIRDDKLMLNIRDDIGEYGFPECPSNGLPMYREFNAEELKRLPALLNDPAFRALRKDTPQPLRSRWLATQLGDSPEARLYLIVYAADMARSRAMRRRLLKMVADAFAITPFGGSIEEQYGSERTLRNSINFRLIYVHTLRELGEFDKAMIELKALPLGGLNGIVPSPIYGPEEGDGDDPWRAALNQEEIGNREADRNTLEEVSKVERIVLRRDSTPKLLELLSEDDAAYQCENFKPKELSPSNQAYCKKPSIMAKRKLLLEEREEYLRQSKIGEAAEEDSLAVLCANVKAEQARIEALPKPQSPDVEPTSEFSAVDLAACAAFEAM